MAGMPRMQEQFAAMAAAEKCSCIFGMSAIHGRQNEKAPSGSGGASVCGA
jgi:hypothetical protein